MRLLMIASLIWFAGSLVSQAAVVGYHFDGTVAFVATSIPGGTPPFGITVPSTASVSGEFWYDTSSPGTPGGNAFTTTYLQDHWLIMRFAAPAFAGLTAKSWGYQVEVSNDMPQGPTFADRVSFLFAGNLGLNSLIKNTYGIDPVWNVNNSDQTDGLLRLNFQNASGLLDQSIPANLGFAPLPQPGQLFADTAVGMVDVIFTIAGLSSVDPSTEPPKPTPEPSSVALLLIGATVAGAYRRRIARARKPRDTNPGDP
jgi:hypothetical protein